MCSSSDILVDGLGVCFYFISKLVEHFRGGLATDESEVGLLKDGVFVVYVSRHVR